MGSVTVGVDVGQMVDPTAIAVADVAEERTPGGVEQDYRIRAIERLPLQTPYPAVAERVVDLVRRLNVRLRDEGRLGHGPTLYVDITGVGRPVVDELHRALGRERVTLVGVTLTGSDRCETRQSSARYRELLCGKAYMVSRLQALLGYRRLHLPKTGEALAARDELLAFQVRSGPTHDQFSAPERTGAHDDLVVALGLACLELPVSLPRFRGSGPELHAGVPAWVSRSASAGRVLTLTESEGWW